MQAGEQKRYIDRLNTLKEVRRTLRQDAEALVLRPTRSRDIGQSALIGCNDRAWLLLDAGGTAVKFFGSHGHPMARLAAPLRHSIHGPTQWFNCCRNINKCRG